MLNCCYVEFGNHSGEWCVCVCVCVCVGGGGGGAHLLQYSLPCENVMGYTIRTDQYRFTDQVDT